MPNALSLTRLERTCLLTVLAVAFAVSQPALAQRGVAGDSTSAARPTRASIAQRVDSVVRNFLANSGPSAMSIAIMRGADTLVFDAWGLANRERNIAATPTTPYHIASVTKQFTAALVLRLAERSRISLTDTIGTYLPTLPRGWHGVTITQLLNHTAGIPDDGEDEFRWAEPLTPPALIAVKILSDSLRFPAGSRWEYSNTGYVALGMLIEKLYGRPFAEVLQREITTPLRLTNTSYCPVEYGANGQAVGYDRNGASFKPADFLHVSHEFSAGGVCSTVGDLSKWTRALHSGQVVNPQSYALMTTPQGAAVGDRYGFGLRLTTYAGRAAIEHGGSIFGFVSFSVWLPGDSLSVSVLANTNPIPGGRAVLLPDLVRLAVGLPVRIGPRAIAMNENELLKYTGRYTLELPNRPANMQIIAEGDHLIAQLQGQAPFSMWASAPNVFGTPNEAVRITFAVDSNRVNTFILEQGNVKVPATRKN